jgi:hypothetical protein
MGLEVSSVGSALHTDAVCLFVCGAGARRLVVQGFTPDRPALKNLLDVGPALECDWMVQGFTPDRVSLNNLLDVGPALEQSLSI